MPVWLKAPSQWAPSQGAPRPPPSTGLGSPIRDLDTKFNTKRRPANRRAALGSDWYREVQPPKAPGPSASHPPPLLQVLRGPRSGWRCRGGWAFRRPPEPVSAALAFPFPGCLGAGPGPKPCSGRRAGAGDG